MPRRSPTLHEYLSTVWAVGNHITYCVWQPMDWDDHVQAILDGRKYKETRLDDQTIRSCCRTCGMIQYWTTDRPHLIPSIKVLACVYFGTIVLAILFLISVVMVLAGA